MLHRSVTHNLDQLLSHPVCHLGALLHPHSLLLCISALTLVRGRLCAHGLRRQTLLLLLGARRRSISSRGNGTLDVLFIFVEVLFFFVLLPVCSCLEVVVLSVVLLFSTLTLVVLGVPACEHGSVVVLFLVVVLVFISVVVHLPRHHLLDDVLREACLSECLCFLGQRFLFIIELPLLTVEVLFVLVVPVCPLTPFLLLCRLCTVNLLQVVDLEIVDRVSLPVLSVDGFQRRNEVKHGLAVIVLVLFREGTALEREPL
mmetsp:Transcript_1530/g.3197  ORF Transcript_1530/g.3197 Transcript_1530/m.3197 type:complete len:258 (-) Transcript_1530:543-1316(-)